MTTISLSVLDRLNVKKLFIEKCSMVTASLQKDIEDKLKLSQEELTEIDFKSFPNGIVQWNAEKAKDAEFKFSPAELKLLQSQIATLDKVNQLEYAAYDTFLKIKGADSTVSA